MSKIRFIRQLKFPQFCEKISSPLSVKFTPVCWCSKDLKTNSTTFINRDLSTAFPRNFCQNNGRNTNFTTQRKYVNKEIKAYIQQNKDKLRNTEQRIKLKGSILLKDIRETKDKVREKVENIIDVS